LFYELAKGEVAFVIESGYPVDAEPDWDLAAQPALNFDADQRLNV
jgi:hypothetical protein